MAASNDDQTSTEAGDNSWFTPPAVNLPKSGGSIRGMGEKFSTNPVTGTASLSIPFCSSPGRSGFTPQLGLSYNSGSGNGPFGFGWQMSVPSITRKTDKGIPKYEDAVESDVFQISGAEDLVHFDGPETENWTDSKFKVDLYKPRTEAAFIRIERWTDQSTGDVHWRTLTAANVTTVYGQNQTNRIFDPQDTSRVFSWLACWSYDDRGNAMVYEYKRENSQNVDSTAAHEMNRTESSRSAQIYLKRVKYGNRQSRLIQPDMNKMSWLFELVFDYGDHSDKNPKPSEDRDWSSRTDAFSSYRSGFEIRSYRLCRRILMFHHFPDEPNLGLDCLVRSTDFTFQHCDRIASFISKVTQWNYLRDGTNEIRKSLPPLEFEYTEAELSTEVQNVRGEDLNHGANEDSHEWVDLNGEGILGLLTRQQGAWYYRKNLGQGRLGPAQQLSRHPSLASSPANHQFMDLSGDGLSSLVNFSIGTQGFFKRDAAGGWADFRNFSSLPQLDWKDANLRYIDLNGDGLADLLIFENEVVTWYPSLGEDGFGPALRTTFATDEDRGVRLIFQDPQLAIFLADMTGDGLNDVVRIRNGDVSYWPNLGYGRFGAKVSMDDAPHFEAGDCYDSRRVRLADIDGSGSSDLIYFGSNGAQIYMNQSGNSWGEAKRLECTPSPNQMVSFQVMDFTGTGTATLLWVSSLPGQQGHSIQYVDLMSRKPHLLTKVCNGFGAETSVSYASSVKYYLRDNEAGTPWLTRLPFPVHVVERVEAVDRISKRKSTSLYSYRHGYFDGSEREFRGFAYVELQDSEEFSEIQDQTSYIPPALTKTWFHTGAHFGDGKTLSERLADEYFEETGLSKSEKAALCLSATEVPTGLATHDWVEAIRAFKGQMLRREVYSLDQSEKQIYPYQVSQKTYAVKQIQPREHRRHGIFYCHPRENLELIYERSTSDSNAGRIFDPRMTHSLSLAIDDFGHTTRSVSIAYPRRNTIHRRPEQSQTDLTFRVSQFVNDSQRPEGYRLGVKIESRTYEVVHPIEARATARIIEPFRFAEILTLTENLLPSNQNAPDPGLMTPFTEWDWREKPLPSSGPKLRLIEHARTLYRKDNLHGPLPLGQVDTLALPYGTYTLSFDQDVLNTAFRKKDSSPIVSNIVATLENQTRYLSSREQKRLGLFPADDEDQLWWISTGQCFFSPPEHSSFDEELDFARAHFFFPVRFQNAFGAISQVAYDPYDLIVQQAIDPFGNTVTAGERDLSGRIVKNGIDYRLLQPWLTMDPNRNRSSVAFDSLGMVVGTAIMGKPEEQLGDSLAGFSPELTQEQIQSLWDSPLENAAEWLQQAASRVVYDADAYLRTKDSDQPQPTVTFSLTRNVHALNSTGMPKERFQRSFSYCDGFGRQIQIKSQAEPEAGESHTRWVSSGTAIYNNKGLVVRRFEPYFSNSHHFTPGHLEGVASTTFYDPLGRAIGTLYPNHTFDKLNLDPWRQEAWDVCDNALLDNPRQDPDLGPYFTRLPESVFLPTWYQARISGDLGEEEKIAAQKSAVHSKTPSRSHFDCQGRLYLTESTNRVERDGAIAEEQYTNTSRFDGEGNQREVWDALGRLAATYSYSIDGQKIHHSSMDSGDRWSLPDVDGKPNMAWDCRGRTFRTSYDSLRRLIGVHVIEEVGTEKLIEKSVFGDSLPDAEAKNLRGRLYQAFDEAGIATCESYDFKGNLISSTRQLTADYKVEPDWNASPSLDAEIFRAHTLYDAQNRVVQFISPHSQSRRSRASVLQTRYNDAGMVCGLDVWSRIPDVPTELLESSSADLKAITAIEYDAQGRQRSVTLGNGVKRSFDYDPLTSRLSRIQTSGGFQDLSYAYDARGCLVSVLDHAQPTIFFRNQRVDAHSRFVYDSLSRLVEAQGREHLGQNGVPAPIDNTDIPHIGLVHPDDGHALGRYQQSYSYDLCGNLLQMAHKGLDLARRGWTRRYLYEEESLCREGQRGDRLTGTQIGQDPVQRLTYDAHGNVVDMNPLFQMTWDHRDQLSSTARQDVNEGTPETTYYVYDASGTRVRKVTESAAAPGQTPRRKSERIYINGFEVYREYESDGLTVSLERETQQASVAGRKIALIESRTAGDDGSPARVYRYQLDNHLGSSTIELDDRSRVISYEEYYPYGSTSYQAQVSQTQTSKRYRYAGKERDEESGFVYCGSRYYAPWIGRWTSCDPSGMSDGTNLYCYVGGNPMQYADPIGQAGTKPQAQFGNIEVYWQQGKAVRDTFKKLMSTHEHIGARGLWERITSSYDKRSYRRSETLTIPKDMADIKTRTDNSLMRQVDALSGAPAPLQLADQIRPGVADAERTILARDQALANRRAAGQAVDDLLSITDHKIHKTSALQMGELFEAGSDRVRGELAGALEEIEHAFDQWITPAPDAPAPTHAAAPSLPEAPSAPAHSPPAGHAPPPAVPEAPPPAPRPPKPAAKPPAPPAPKVTAGRRALRVAGGTLDVAGKALEVVGVGMSGYQVGTGLVEISEGKVGEGTVNVAEGGSNIALTIGTASALKSGTLVAEGGAAAGGLTLAAGAAATGALYWAFEDTRRALRGEKTMTDEAVEYWSERGFTGTMKDFWHAVTD